MDERTDAAPTAAPPYDPPPSYRHARLHGERVRVRRSRGHGPLRRATDEPILGGVAAGVSARLGVDVTLVRVGFVVASLASGMGAAAYVLGWLLLPRADDGSTIMSRAATDRRGISLAAGLATALALLLLVSSAVGLPWLGSLTWPLVAAAGGLALVWRNAPADEQVRLRRVAEPVLQLSDGRRGARLRWRLGLGALLLVIGLVELVLGHPSNAALRPLAGLLLVIAGIVVVLGPWWLRIGRDLVVERQARARAEERADIAARVHDSVLQTLALIQRRADQPQQVVRLARAQERELRAWLYGGRPPGSLREDAASFAAGVALIQQDVEATHGTTVEAVTVGDCPLDERLEALLAAAREATVNAAKWSGAPLVSLFAEVGPDAVSVFVRDRGRGFDPAAVPGDRKGLAESVHGRMGRAGGTAEVHSADGEGTEVRLRLPRAGSRR